MLKFEAKIFDITGKLKAIELNDDEGEPLEKRKRHKSTTTMNGVKNHHRTLNHQSVPPGQPTSQAHLTGATASGEYTTTPWEF